MTAYTSTQSGNFNDAATWGGGGFPTTGDTATIAANHVITVPASTTSTCGAITFNAGSGGNFTQLVINGTYNSGGTITTAANSKLKIGAGGVFDLNGYNVACGGSLTYYEFKGTAVSRATVQSTGSAGSFTNTTNVLIADFDYCDVSGLGDSTFGRSHTSAYVHNYLHSTFTGCGSLNFDATGTNAGAGFNIKYCDFRNPSSATPVASEKYYPNVYLTSATATADRVIDSCTWETDGTTALNYVEFNVARGLIVRNNVFSNLRINHNNSTHQIVYDGNFFTGDIDVSGQREWFSNTVTQLYQFTNNYCCWLFGDHPFAVHSAGGVMNFQNNICEYAGTANAGYGTNWLLNNNPSSQTITIKNNIMIGEGTLLTFTGNATVTADISNNTFYIENDGTIGSSLYFPPILLTEQASTLSGTVNIYNNIVIDPDTTGDRDAAIDLLNNTADQVDFLDYNVGWGYPGGALTPPVLYDVNVVVTAGEGVNDFSADPQFIDKTRKLSTWDAYLGGPGTVDNAVAELLKANSSDYDYRYSTENLIKHVRRGFTPKNAALTGSGYSAGDIGALPVFTSAAYKVNADNYGFIMLDRDLTAEEITKIEAITP